MKILKYFSLGIISAQILLFLFVSVKYPERLIVIKDIPFLAQVSGVSTSGLIAQYNFNGDTRDSQGGHDGVASGGVSYTTGAVVQAVNFNGADGKVTVPHSAELNPSTISISFWLNVPSLPADNNNTVIEKSPGSNKNRVRVLPTGELNWMNDVNSNSLISSSKITPNSWSYWTLVGDSAGLKIYRNGSLDKSNANSYVPVTNTGALLIGGGTYYFKGAVDDLRFYSRVLSVSEIQSIYALGPAEYLTCTYDNPSWSTCVNSSQTRTLTAQNQPCEGSLSKVETQTCVVAPPATTYTVTVSASNGTVTKVPDKSSYTAGELVTLTASSSAGYVFSSWSGDLAGTTSPQTLTINGDKNIMANFDPETVIGEPPVARITVWPGTSVKVGQEVYFDGTQTTDDKALVHARPEPAANFTLPMGRFEWVFGDGYAVQNSWQGDHAWYAGKDSGIAATHFFMTPGTYTVSLRVTDTDGNVNTATVPITVTGEKPISGFELWHADFTARTAQYLYTQIPLAYQGNASRLIITIESDSGYSNTLFDGQDLSAEETVLLKNSNLPAGNYIVTAELFNSDGSHASVVEERFSKSYTGAPTVGIDENNSIIVNGELYFPVTPFILDPSKVSTWSAGKYINTLYGIGYYPDTMTYSARWQDYLSIGSNNNWLVIGPTLWEGLGLLHHERNSDPNKIATLVNQTKNSSALLGWMWKDEPNLGGWGNNIPAPVSRAWTVMTHRYDDQHPVITNHYGFDFLPYANQLYAEPYNFTLNEKYFGKKVSVFDITGLDNYPYEYREGVSYLSNTKGVIDQHLESIDILDAREAGLVPICDFIESQDIRAYRNTPGPTADQINMLAWGDIVHGVKCLGWFHYFETIPAANYTAMAKVQDQTSRLKDVILLAEPDMTVTDDSNARANRVDTMIRETATDIWVFAVRVTEPDTEWGELSGAAYEPESLTTTFSVSGLAGNALATVFDEGRTVSVASGVFSDTFSREAVHIYKIPKAVSVDVTPPVISLFSPITTLPVGTAETVMSLSTDESATCKYAKNGNQSYDSMSTFPTSGARAHTLSISDLVDGTVSLYYVRCSDSLGNVNTSDYEVVISIASPEAPTAAVISLGQPEDRLPAGTATTTLSVMTDRAASCRYDDSPNTPYSSMAGVFSTTGGQSHSVTIAGLYDGVTATYYVRCSVSGAENTGDYQIVVQVATPAVTVTPTINTSSRSGGGGGGGRTLSPIAPSALSAPNLSVCQFIELLITIGSIDSSKVPAARKVFGCGITTVTAPVTTFLAKAPLLTMNLYPEMRSPQVIALKKFLSKYGYLSGVSGTDYYGTLTVEAVQKFQKAKNIITVGTPSTTGYGAVGPKTRALINQIGL